MVFTLLYFTFAESQTILVFTEIAPGTNVPPPTTSCNQVNNAGQDANDDSMALPDKEHRESGNESDEVLSQNEEEEEAGDSLTGETSIDFFILFCNDSLD